MAVSGIEIRVHQATVEQRANGRYPVNRQVHNTQDMSVDKLASEVEALLKTGAEISHRIEDPESYRIDPGNSTRGVGHRQLVLGWVDRGILSSTVDQDSFPNRVVVSVHESSIDFLGFERVPFSPLPQLVSMSFPSETIRDPQGKAEMLGFVSGKIMRTTLPIDLRYHSR